MSQLVQLAKPEEIKAKHNAAWKAISNLTSSTSDLRIPAVLAAWFPEVEVAKEQPKEKQ